MVGPPDHKSTVNGTPDAFPSHTAHGRKSGRSLHPSTGRHPGDDAAGRGWLRAGRGVETRRCARSRTLPTLPVAKRSDGGSRRERTDASKWRMSPERTVGPKDTTGRRSRQAQGGNRRALAASRPDHGRVHTVRRRPNPARSAPTRIARGRTNGADGQRRQTFAPEVGPQSLPSHSAARRAVSSEAVPRSVAEAVRAISGVPTVARDVPRDGSSATGGTLS